MLRSAQTQKNFAWTSSLICSFILGALCAQPLISRYNRLQSSGGAEAIRALNSIAKAQHVFRAKQGRFATRLDELGALDLDLRRMSVGFLQSGPDEVRHPSSQASWSAKGYAVYRPESAWSVAQQYCANCTATADAFRVLAIGYVNASALPEAWTLDQFGNLVHLIDPF
jgi:hypothetical protein